jgi:metal-responsive CopG/Arc/MetJ family transcriptional regulator
MKRFQIMMSEPLMEDLKKHAQAKGLATSDVIRRACEEYLATAKAKEQSPQKIP